MYNESTVTKFRWRRSHIRQLFLAALDVPVNTEEPQNASTGDTTQGPTPSESTNKSSSTNLLATPQAKNGSGSDDPKEADLEEAKRLCDVTEDELRKKPTEDLHALIKSLTSVSQRMQEQAAYWLDAKEQLVMDAEMHNKMIASLVQYAQQQQVAKPAGRTKSPNKKGVKRR
ncbi:hypothetical protein HK102_008553 [Quaeritorhiza haematococci]|nr:hypothetical protein HK102_008553 [Quaeritorhiza haematococci]